MDELEKYYTNYDNSSDIVIAVKMEIKKLNRYYLKTNNTTMYTVATGKLIIN